MARSAVVQRQVDALVDDVLDDLVRAVSDAAEALSSSAVGRVSASTRCPPESGLPVGTRVLADVSRPAGD